MPRSSNYAGLAIKTGYFLLAAMALVFVVMLMLTVLHPQPALGIEVTLAGVLIADEVIQLKRGQSGITRVGASWSD